MSQATNPARDMEAVINKYFTDIAGATRETIGEIVGVPPQFEATAHHYLSFITGGQMDVFRFMVTGEGDQNLPPENPLLFRHEIVRLAQASGAKDLEALVQERYRAVEFASHFGPAHDERYPRVQELANYALFQFWIAQAAYGLCRRIEAPTEREAPAEEGDTPTPARKPLVKLANVNLTLYYQKGNIMMDVIPISYENRDTMGPTFLVSAVHYVVTYALGNPLEDVIKGGSMFSVELAEKEQGEVKLNSVLLTILRYERTAYNSSGTHSFTLKEYLTFKEHGSPNTNGSVLRGRFENRSECITYTITLK
ncbi:hypothetical protein COY95_03000 [Candidatus Woesearchaeota archaeon CG_4_10_14_0_8_um_filter_47_5]|nr:MAG: hypothetical protein COY95_03000 [Candidatus Woesearchaeota archaeon CG_4_10_14_0_8_um_filter_47_5]